MKAVQICTGFIFWTFLIKELAKENHMHFNEFIVEYVVSLFLKV